MKNFIDVYNHEPVKIGDLEKNSEATKVARTNFQKRGILDAAKRDGLGELTLRADEAGQIRVFINPANV